MIVEDESITAMALAESVRAMGYEVVATVSSGEEAITTARQSHLDVVIMDIQLRGLVDGVSAARTIRKEVGVPCIFLTAYSDVETLTRAKVSEPYGYVVKPYNEKELRAAIEIALHNNSMDIDRRAAHASLGSREKLFQDVLDGGASVVYMKDLEGRFLFVNRQFETLFGVTRSQARGKDAHEISSSAELERLARDDASHAHDPAAAGLQRSVLELGGSTFAVSRSILRGPHGEPYGVGVVMLEIGVKIEQDDIADDARGVATSASAASSARMAR